MLREKLGILLFLLISGADTVYAQINNYTPPSNTQTIPKNSLVIGMDNTTQSKGSLFNLKAYGLVNFLLKNNIPVRRIIKNKSNTGDVDMSVSAQLIFPNTGSPAGYGFKSGPYVIDSSYASQANTLISQFGGSVKVYKTLANVSANVALTLTDPSYIALLSDGGNYQFYRVILDSAGFAPSDYSIISAVNLNNVSCFTFACESDNLNNTLSDTAITNPVKRFVNSGGNFMAQYGAVTPYENNNHFVSLLGLAGTNNSSMTYQNVAHPFIQIDGPVLDAQGSFKSMLIVGGSFLSNTYAVIQDNSGTGANYKALTRKYSTTPKGGHVFYMAGQPSNYEWLSNDSRNAYKIFLNAAMMPAQVLNLCTQSDVKVSVATGKTKFCPADTLSVMLVARNTGGKAANNVNFKNPQGAGFSLIAASPSHGSYQPSSNTWSLAALQPGASDSLRLDYLVSSPGSFSMKLYVVKNVIDFNQQNDSAAISFQVNSLPMVNAGKDTGICYGFGMRLGTDSLPGNMYQWTAIGNSFSSSSAKPFITAFDDLSYILCQKDLSSGCVATDSVRVTVNPLPLVDLGKDREICSGDSLSLSVSYNPDLLCSWSSSPPGISGTDINIKAMISSQTSFYLSRTSSTTGCQGRDSVTVRVSLPPSVSVTGNDTVTYHLDALLSAAAASQGTGKWSIVEGGGDIENPLLPQSGVANLQPGRNLFRWTISSGSCEPSHDDMLIFVKDLEVPQGFSPNGDGVNDEFSIEGIYEFPENRLEVFNRWGMLVFEGEHYENGWRGENRQGEKLPDDTYYYVISIPDKGTYKSYVVLKR